MKLSVIIVSYNTSRLLQNCLKAIYEDLKRAGLTEKSEVIVVDNASKDNSVNMVGENFPSVKLIRNPKNLGFGRANNLGIKRAMGTHLLLLNSDTEVTPDTLKTLLRVIAKDKTIGVLGCKLLNADHSVQQSAGFFPGISRVFMWMMFLDDIGIIQRYLGAYHLSDPSFYEKEHDVDWISGACFFIKREIIAGAGLFDENIFMYGEELEWCYRIKKAGFRILYTPKACVFHFRGGSAEKDRQNAGIIEEFKTLIYFYKKHKSYIETMCLRVLIISGALLRIGLFAIIRKYNYRIRTYVKAIYMAGQ